MQSVSRAGKRVLKFFSKTFGQFRKKLYLCSVFMNIIKRYNNMDKCLYISGKKINYTKLDRHSVKGVWVDAVARYTFASSDFQGTRLLLLILKDGAVAYTPFQCKTLADKLQKENGMPVVFCFERLDFNGRERMMAQGVFFIVGDKYAYLPSLVIAGRGNAKPKANELTATAQYLLLYHLQVRTLEGLSAKEMAQILPYKYVTLTLAMQVLEELDICEIRTDESKTRRLHFPLDGKMLYEQIMPFLHLPVRKSFYCDRVETELAISGINALSRYSMLAPVALQTLAIEERRFNLKAKNCPFIGMNNWEGKYKIELWKYPPIVNNGVVDKISLALALANEDDPRVQKEIKTMIEGLWSKE